MAISGAGVGVATLGGLLIYAGMTKQSLPAALRSISTGRPTPVVSRVLTAESTGAGAVTQASAVTGTGSGLTSLPQACYLFRGDRYSQANRWADGYSDCSSFAGKALKAIGVTPPGASTTLSYLASPQWKSIPVAQAGAGDLLVNATHMVVVINPTTAIGQENPARNVQIGSFADLMDGTGPYSCLRYAGSGGAPAASLGI